MVTSMISSIFPGTAADKWHMRTALTLALRGLGQTWPNPAVGCVLVDDDGHVVARGWTQPGGRPHAEQMAVKIAGEKARGTTAYVSLEPCAHFGQTPPCAKVLIDAQVRRVVVATGDPDTRVAGKGIEMLKTAGIEVQTGLYHDHAARLNQGFITKTVESRPFVTLKTATSLDGYIATGTGHSQWMTSPPARHMTHCLRSQYDAILIGSGTALADDPMLTCRLEGLEDRSPVRVVLDTTLKLPLESQLVKTARDVPVWVATLKSEDDEKAQALGAAGVVVLSMTKSKGDVNAPLRVDINELLSVLAIRGITRLMVEGGSHVNAAFLREGLVDQLLWFRAPKIVGADGLGAVQAFGVEKLEFAANFRQIQSIPLGMDHLEIYDVER